ncbi:muscarinic acetylcholine receptor M3-like [Anneissia japonica]|uniref:muscarinic acetylcholine receptor M3-like n=1 Tax=Anneissia japonica TaxID=1529436 RepID=UPI0014258905|nr:muscarinic acetylcholine receptor M3-like [Anneissia japonica]
MDNLSTTSQNFVSTENTTTGNAGLPTESWIAFVGLWLAALVTIIGNSMVIASFIMYRDIRNKVSHLFLLNLAISDLVIGLVSLPLDNMWRWNDNIWPYGRLACVIWTTIDYSATSQSAYSIVLISADRYFLSNKGLGYTSFQTKSRALCQVCLSWFISVGFHLAAVIWFEIMQMNRVDYDEECEMNALQFLPYTILAMFVEFLIPLGIVILLYVYIYLNIRTRSKELVTKVKRKHVDKDVSKDSGVSGVDPLPGTLVDTKVCPLPTNQENTLPTKKERGRRSETKSKHLQAAKMLSILVGIFIICWLPYNIILMIDVITAEHELISWQVWDMANYLLWLNSAVNPILYAYTNVYFRRSFYNILRWCLSPCCTLKRGRF